MRYKLRDLPYLLKTPVGRRELLWGQYSRFRSITTFLAFVYRRTIIRNVRIVAIIGSLGKTTTARAVATGLGIPVHPNIGRNANVQVAKALLRIRPGNSHGVIEVGVSNTGQMKKYARLIRPDMTVVTSIASEHNRSFKTLDTTREEKSDMVRAVPDPGKVFLNGDDPNVLWMSQKTRASVITYGTGTSNEFYASDIEQRWPDGMKFKLHMDGATFNVNSRLIGCHMIYPLLAAVAVAKEEGFEINQVIQRISSMEPTKGRMQPLHLDNGAVIIRDDFKSAEETIYAALNAFSKIPAKRKVIVLGEVNEPLGSINKLYRDIGENVGKIASRALFLGHKKSCRYYVVGAKQGGLSQDSAVHMGHDILRVARILRDELGPGDVVLIKGRTEQRLLRIALLLEGMQVACDLGACTYSARNCRICPMLSKKWKGLPKIKKKT
ncbi:Mur ligase family protein [Thermodesulfobacteriota bacterium]